ncbi:MAG TPA: hypothetical protein VNJ04_01685 [Gemmatimonadaceae bacterium]|nr:hypothetical protein [Gemmatimonadaceae bacterium]
MPRQHFVPRVLFVLASLSVAVAGAASAKNSSRQISVGGRAPVPRLSYVLTIQQQDSSGFDVAMHVSNAPPTLRIGMAVHPEYNQQFWKQVRNLSVETNGNLSGPVRQLKENVWSVGTRNGEATIRYRIALPAGEVASNRASWKSFLRSGGAFLNAMDTFIYLPDYPAIPAEVTLDVPRDWRIATALTRRADPRVFVAPNAAALLDSPIMMGALRTWTFRERGVPHHIAYWPLPGAAPFDTVQFVNDIVAFTHETVKLMGSMPYREFTFLIQDGAWAGLEHRNSVSLGMASATMATQSRLLFPDLAHEFFHTWNLMALHPRGRAILSTDAPAHTRDLWWSEGLTIYYATLLQHRAGFPEEGRGHAAGLSYLLNRYYENPGNMRISPESGSWSSIDPPAQLDFSSDYYLQGQIIGEMLDLIIRDSTRGRRGIDDVMRAMYTRFAHKRGFTGAEIESTTERVCACNLTKFFDDHVRNAREFDFNRHLAPLGYRLVIDTILAADSAGRALPDLRLYTMNSDDTSRTYVRIMNPESVWAKAGLRTGMELVSFNGARIGNVHSFRRQIRSLKIGDVVNVAVRTNEILKTFLVTIPSYNRVRVELGDVAPLTAAQQRRRALWEDAVPRWR